MKIGLSVAFTEENYGQLLQAFATQEILEKKGHQTEIIDYRRNGFDGIRFTPWLAVYAIKRISKRIKLNTQKNEMLYDEPHQRNLSERKQSADKFRNERLHNIVRCNGNDELIQRGKEYDVVLVGSDQCWLPMSCFGNLRTLRFVPDDVRKVSYATSIGVAKYPLYCRSSARQFLNRFDYISVREEQGKKAIEEICQKKVEVVLDPTYLLTKEDWEILFPSERIVKEKYALCYFLGDNKQSKTTAAKFAREKGLKVVSILSNESYSEIDLSFADEIVIGKGPDEFLNLIRNAEYVFTDSFHGVAFSVINEKQFYVFYRHALSSTGSRNSRIDNILNTWNLQDRLITDSNINRIGQTEINYKKVNSILDNRRGQSLQYLEKALQ